MCSKYREKRFLKPEEKSKNLRHTRNGQTTKAKALRKLFRN